MRDKGKYLGEKVRRCDGYGFDAEATGNLGGISNKKIVGPGIGIKP